MINPIRVRRLRHDRGLSQRQLAKAIGVDPLSMKRLCDEADQGDLTVRVIERLALTLGVSVRRLLVDPGGNDEEEAPELNTSVGAALLAHGRTTRTALAQTFNVTTDDIDQSVAALTPLLAAAGISIPRHRDEVWLAAHVDPGGTTIADRRLRIDEARLLRRIHRGEDVRGRLSENDRQFILPALLRRGLVDDTDAKLALTPAAAASLDVD